MVETLESRQMFCYAPVNLPVAEYAQEMTAEQPLASTNWSGVDRAKQTAEHTSLIGNESLS
jgi:hypothetical protein